MTERIILADIHTVMDFHPIENHWIHRPDDSGYLNIAYQIAGRYRHIYEGETFMMEKDCVLLYHTADRYEVFAEEHGHCIAAGFSFAAPVDLHFSVLDGTKIPQIKADFQRLYKTYNRRDEYSWYESASLSYLILGKILRAADSHEDYIQRMKYENIDRAREYLAGNFSDPSLDLSSAAALAELGQRRFGELFRRLYGTTPGRYITRLRIAAAEDMLRMKRYSIAEIAASVGYTDPGYFCRVFTREVGCPPSLWAGTK